MICRNRGKTKLQRTTFTANPKESFRYPGELAPSSQGARTDSSLQKIRFPYILAGVTVRESVPSVLSLETVFSSAQKNGQGILRTQRSNRLKLTIIRG